MVLQDDYVSSRPKSVCVLISASPTNSVDRGKNSLLLYDLLQIIDYNMFNNYFANQYRFDYYEPSDNEEDDDEIIPPVPEFRDAFVSSFIVYMIRHLVI